MWIKVEDRLPEIPNNPETPYVKRQFRALCAFEDGDVREMVYIHHHNAHHARARVPRWEETNGRLAYSPPTHWRPLPSHPDVKPLFDCHGTFFYVGDYTQAIDCDLDSGDPHWEQAEFLIPTKWLNAIHAAESDAVSCELTVEAVGDTLNITIQRLPDRPTSDEEMKDINDRIDKALPPEDPGVEY